MKEPISVEAIFSKATTTQDGGWRISFDLSQDDGKKVSDISELNGQLLNLVIMTTDYIEETKQESKPALRKLARHGA